MWQKIDSFSLQPGQWVKFSHETKELIKGPFKVIDRDDGFLFDPCRCYLMDIHGTLFDYWPTTCTLDNCPLPSGFTIKMSSNANMTQKLGEQMDAIKKSALEHLKNLACGKSFQKGFDPENEDSGKTLTGAEIRQKYGLSFEDELTDS